LGPLPIVGFSHNLKIASNPKEVKQLSGVQFEPDSFIAEKIGSQTAKFPVKTLVYSLAHNGYATIIKADE
jgi:hypothetical protein